MKESGFWAAVRSGIVGPHWSRIENSAGSGIPDAHGCWQGKDAWVELKMMEGSRISVRASQISWHAKHHVVGGQAWFLVKKDRTIALYPAAVILRAAGNPTQSTPSKDGKSISISLSGWDPEFETAAPYDWKTLASKIFGL
jgi:hypothetical protein